MCYFSFYNDKNLLEITTATTISWEVKIVKSDGLLLLGWGLLVNWDILGAVSSVSFMMKFYLKECVDYKVDLTHKLDASLNTCSH